MDWSLEVVLQLFRGGVQRWGNRRDEAVRREWLDELTRRPRKVDSVEEAEDD